MIFKLEGRFLVATPDADVTSFAWSFKGDRVAVLAGATRRASVFLIPEGARTASVGGLAGGGSTVAWADDGRIVLPPLGAERGAFAVWNYVADVFEGIGPPAGSAEPTGVPGGFYLDRSGRTFASNQIVRRESGENSEIVIYDVVEWRERRRISFATTRIAFSPNAARLAAVGQSGAVQVFDIESGSEILQFRANNNRVKELDWSPDGSTIATGTMAQGYGRNGDTGQYGPLHDEDVLQLWDAATGKRKAVAGIDVGGGVESIEFSGDGTMLLTVTSDRVCRIWDASNLQLMQVVAKDLGPTSALARFSPDSTRILIAKKSTAEALLYRRR